MLSSCLEARLEISSENIGGSKVKQAIADASKTTGTDFGFLLATAVRESSLNPRAEAKTSSATGLFQFLDQSWLTTLKRHGAKHGLGTEASMINIGADGRAYVGDAKVRRDLLNLRYDAKISALMAAEFANDNADFIREKTGKDPQSGDLYAAHFLGAGGASALINAAEDTPWIKASSLFPAAAAANKPIFYKDGRALSVSEVLEGLRATTKDIDSNSKYNAPLSPSDNYSNADLMLAQLQTTWNSSLLNMLGNGGVGFNNQGAANPYMLAQYYQAQDDANQYKAMEIASGALNSNNIAEVLSPEPNNEDESGINLRGRK